MSRLLVTLLSIITCTIASAQIKVTSEQTYDEGALYGYMNGGSELYKEYQFQKLTVQELEVDGQELKFECFEMASPLMAFGIFSVNVYQCHSTDSHLSVYVCQSDYQLQAVCGNKYLSVINYTGKTDAQKAADKLMLNFINSNHEQTDEQQPKYIKQLNADRVMYMNGLLSVENRAAQWADIYKQLELNSCFILQWHASKVSVMVFTDDYKMPVNNLGDYYLLKVKEGIVYIAIKGYNDNFIEELFKTL